MKPNLKKIVRQLRKQRKLSDVPFIHLYINAKSWGCKLSKSDYQGMDREYGVKMALIKRYRVHCERPFIDRSFCNGVRWDYNKYFKIDSLPF